jgi:hypothetical protein
MATPTQPDRSTDGQHAGGDAMKPRGEPPAAVLDALGLLHRPVRSRRALPRSSGPQDFTQLVSQLDLEAIDALLELIGTRELHDTPYPYVHIDVVPAVPPSDTVRDLVTATGVTDDGDFEPLGFTGGDAADPGFWEDFVDTLKSRGLHGVRVVGSPDIEGLRAVVHNACPGARWRASGPITSVSLAEALEIIRRSESADS